MTQALWRNPEDREWIPDTGHCLDLIVTVPWYFPLEIRKYLTFFFFILQNPTVERLNFYRDFRV